LNYFGPKHTGGLAFLVSVPTAIAVVVLGLFALPHLGQAFHNLKPLSEGMLANSNGFVGIVLALSGVEAIANATSLMKLDPGSTEENPTVSKTSTPAILWVMAEVCIFTALLGLGMIALSQRNRPTALLALCSRAASPRAGRSKAQMDRRRRSQGDFCLRKKQG
jgi:hypothetical protein